MVNKTITDLDLAMEMFANRPKSISAYDTTEFERVNEYMESEFGQANATRMFNAVVYNAKHFDVLPRQIIDYSFFNHDLELKRRAYIFMAILKSRKFEDVDFVKTLRRISEKSAKHLCELSIVFGE